MTRVDDHAAGAHPSRSERPEQRDSGFRIGLRGRMLGAILVVALTTVGVGAFGIHRMSELSTKAEVGYEQGAVPLDGLRRLEADWWQLSANVARSNVTSLPPDSIAKAQRGAAEYMQILSDQT
jgi:methyl-accepting chemotaxis protein